MVGNSDWTIEFYVDENDSVPVEEFLESLDAWTRARFVWSIEQLRIRNVTAREPLARHLEGDLWELRTPRGELETARRRYSAFLDAQQGRL